MWFFGAFSRKLVGHSGHCLVQGHSLPFIFTLQCNHPHTLVVLWLGLWCWGDLTLETCTIWVNFRSTLTAWLGWFRWLWGWLTLIAGFWLHLPNVGLTNFPSGKHTYVRLLGARAGQLPCQKLVAIELGGMGVLGPGLVLTSACHVASEVQVPVHIWKDYLLCNNMCATTIICSMCTLYACTLFMVYDAFMKNMMYVFAVVYWQLCLGGGHVSMDATYEGPGFASTADWPE